MEKIEVKRNNNLFFIKVNDKIASSLRYNIEKDIMYIVSTFTLPAYRGRGLASKLMQEAVNYAISSEIRKIKVHCSYARHWFKKHPEYATKFKSIDHEEI